MVTQVKNIVVRGAFGVTHPAGCFASVATEAIFNDTSKSRSDVSTL